MIFLSNIEHCAEANQRKKKSKAKWDAIQTELQIMKNDSLRSWPHDARAAHRHTQTDKHQHSHTYSHTRTATYLHDYLPNFWTNTLNEATVGRTPSSVLRNPIKVQKDIKSFSPFNKVDLFVVWLNSWILDSTVISCFQSRISKTEHSIHNDKFPFCYLPFPCKLRENETQRQQSGTLLLLCVSTCHW